MTRAGGRCLRILSGAMVVSLAGCHLLQLTPGGNKPAEREPITGAPAKYSHRVAPYVFQADFEIPRHSPLFRELAAMREQICRDLKLPQSNAPIYVYLFEDRQRYESFMRSKYPELPKRRAFFVAQPRRLGGAEELMVFTWWGDNIRRDLRHELTHAILHSVLKDVPLWLDEGLAEYYEMPPTNNGINFEHLDQLCRPQQGQPRPNLARLEQLSEVQHMLPGEYREAWAWVHLMLRGQGQARQILLQYLQDLRSNPRPGPMEPRLAQVFLSVNEALDRHLAQLDRQPRPAAAQQ